MRSHSQIRNRNNCKNAGQSRRKVTGNVQCPEADGLTHSLRTKSQGHAKATRSLGPACTRADVEDFGLRRILGAGAYLFRPDLPGLNQAELACQHTPTNFASLVAISIPDRSSLRFRDVVRRSPRTFFETCGFIPFYCLRPLSNLLNRHPRPSLPSCPPSSPSHSKASGQRSIRPSSRSHHASYQHYRYPASITRMI
jgi:hypothetical protein